MFLVQAGLILWLAIRADLALPVAGALLLLHALPGDAGPARSSIGAAPDLTDPV
jgi:hypothetical protein